MLPGGTYNGTIVPLMPYAIKGVIRHPWGMYGEQQEHYLAAQFKLWREKWGEPEMTFLMVQVPNFGPPPKEPGDSNWSELREPVLQTTLTVPKTGMAVTHDIGDANDLHPTNKEDVGKRLALAARAIAYGEPIEYAGPTCQSMAVEGNRVRLRFTHLGGGLVARGGEPLRQFAIAGEDKRFVWANAKIEGDTVVVSSDKVGKPVAVRYAWSDNPEGCNLYNKAGLPASSFRTDDWRVRSTPRWYVVPTSRAGSVSTTANSCRNTSGYRSTGGLVAAS